MGPVANQRLSVPVTRPELVWIPVAGRADGRDPTLPYTSTSLYQATMTQLKAKGYLYPCTCSRKDIQQTQRAPHAADDEWLYPGTCRPSDSASIREITDQPHCWRFKVPKGEHIAFEDGRLGPLSYEAGRDFGDFVIWRSDGVPSYQLAVTVDDHRMQVTEVVRGEDLLVSTARQLLIYRALGWQAPDFYHCPLVCDAHGQRLAKRDASLSLRTIRQQGSRPGTQRCVVRLVGLRRLGSTHGTLGQRSFKLG